MTASANSTIVMRETSPPNPWQARRATKEQATAVPPPLRKRKSMQQRCVPDEYRHPCRRAQISCLPNVHLLDAEHGVGPGQRTSTAYSASSVSLSTNPCPAATTGCKMCRWRLGSHEGGHALRARSGISLCVGRAPVIRHCDSGVIRSFNWLFFS